MKNVEIWKEYPITFVFEGFYRVEVSNEGKLKTYSSMHPDGKIIKGSMQGGYICLRAKLRSKWSVKDTAAIQSIQTEVDFLNGYIKELLKENTNAVELLEVRETRDKLVQKRKKLNTKLTNKNTINFSVLFHKAVAELFLDAPEDENQKFVIHKDFDKLNNRVDNLEWASQEEINERVKKHPKMILWEFKKQFVDQSMKVKTSKLSEMDVLTIKTRLKRGYPLKKLAKQFGVSDMQIHRIKTGENWGHVKEISQLVQEQNANQHYDK